MAATRFADSLSITTGALESEVSRATARLEERRFRHALFDRRADAWSRDADVQRTIANRLGWLASPAAMTRELPRLFTFADGVVRDGFTDVVLLGMGGSSLAPEVLRAVVGVRPGRPRFTTLDSVNPDHLRTITTDPHRSLYVLASKSGSTIEPNVLAAYFRQRLLDAGISRWGAHFVAITDPGTALDTRATAEGFREVFRNPPDIGGRYSAIADCSRMIRSGATTCRFTNIFMGKPEPASVRAIKRDGPDWWPGCSDARVRRKVWVPLAPPVL